MASFPANALNVYLVDLRENRTLRSNEVARSVTGGDVFATPAHRRMDCHYLISAWSPAPVSPLVEPTLDEHALLYDVATVLANRDALVPKQVYAPNPLPAGFPDFAADAELPTQVMPVEGYIKLPEFWGTMGNVHRLKPVVYLVVTVPLAMETQRAGAIVTTRIAEFRIVGKPGAGEVRIEIGGYVRNSAQVEPDGSFAPVPGAWVELQAPPGTRLQLVQADVEGRFTFSNLRPQKYRFIATATGLAQTQRDIDVPSPSGEYHLQF